MLHLILLSTLSRLIVVLSLVVYQGSFLSPHEERLPLVEAVVKLEKVGSMSGVTRKPFQVLEMNSQKESSIGFYSNDSRSDDFCDESSVSSGQIPKSSNLARSLELGVVGPIGGAKPSGLLSNSSQHCTAEPICKLDYTMAVNITSQHLTSCRQGVALFNNMWKDQIADGTFHNNAYNVYGNPCKACDYEAFFAV